MKNKNNLALIGILMFHACHIALIGVSIVKVTVVNSGGETPEVISTPLLPLDTNGILLFILAGIIGFIFIVISLFKCREKWFFWYSIILSILMIPTILGIISLIYLILKREEFKQPKQTEPEIGAYAENAR